MKENAIKLVKALAVSALLVVILLLILSGVGYFAGLNRNQLEIGVMIVHLIGNLAGSFIFTRNVGRKNFFCGMAFAGAYLIMLLLISFMVGGLAIEIGIKSVKVLILCMTGALVGSFAAG